MFQIAFDISHNADFTHEFTWLDNAGAPVPMVGSTLRMHVKKKASDTKAALEMTTANGLAVIFGASSNQFRLKFPKFTLLPTTEAAEGLDADKPYVFDLIEITSADVFNKIATGFVTVRRGATL